MPVPDAQVVEEVQRNRIVMGFESSSSLIFFRLLSQPFKFLHNCDGQFHLDHQNAIRNSGDHFSFSGFPKL